MRVESLEGRRSQGEVPVHTPIHVEQSERLPLLDLRTRIVLLLLVLVFWGVVLLGSLTT